MTAAFLPPPKSFRGLTARELMSAENVDTPGVPLGPPKPPIVALPIADGMDVTVMTGQPAAETLYWPAQRPYYDATAQTEMRVVADVEDAGAVGAELVARATTDGATYFNPGWVDPACTIAATGPQKGEWVPVASAARADVAFAIKARGGDGVETPVVGKAHIQFRQGTPTLFTRRYWRTTAPSIDPPDVLNVGALGDFWSCNPPLGIEGWLTPDASTIQANVGSLLTAKGNAETSVLPTSTDLHINVSGPVLMFVSPPLAAQVFDNVPWRAMWKGQAPSANTAGYAAPRLAVWRPSLGQYVAYGAAIDEGPLWFRFIARARVAESVFLAYDCFDCAAPVRLTDFTTEEGDRLVMFVGAGLATGCGGLQTTEGFGAWISYNGGYDKWTGQELIEFDPTGGTASYLDLPTSVEFLSETA